MKHLFLILAFAVGTIAGKAQTVTQEEMQGKWRIAAYNPYYDYGSIDVENGTYTISDNADDKQDAENKLKQTLQESKDYVMTISDDKITEEIAGKKKKTKFTLADFKNKTYIGGIVKSGLKPIVYLKDGKLYWVETYKTIIFKKIE